MRVLLAETNWNAMTAATGLEAAGLLVTRVNDGSELLDFARFGEQSAVVFDMDIPDMRGLDLMRELRAKHPRLPVYVLTSDASWDNRSRIYEAGADDVMSGPVDPDFLAARIKAAVRRAEGYALPTLRTGELDVDTMAQTASINGNFLRLTRKEYEIVEMLALKRERLVTREAFMNHLYAWDDEPDARIINVYLSRIRQQISACGGDPEMLETVWGLGYRLTATPLQVAAA